MKKSLTKISDFFFIVIYTKNTLKREISRAREESQQYYYDLYTIKADKVFARLYRSYKQFFKEP